MYVYPAPSRLHKDEALYEEEAVDDVGLRRQLHDSAARFGTCQDLAIEPECPLSSRGGSSEDFHFCLD